MKLSYRTDKPVRECAKDPTFKKVWDKLVKAVPVSTEKRNRYVLLPVAYLDTYKPYAIHL